MRSITSALLVTVAFGALATAPYFVFRDDSFARLMDHQTQTQTQIQISYDDQIDDLRAQIERLSHLDHERIAFYGDSTGAFYGLVITALQPRLKASVLLGGGLPPARFPKEIDPINFASRVHVPTLMVAGRGDFLVPVETAQKPLFRLLGVAPEHKRHRLFDGGHAPGQLPDVIREILDWFDRYLGAVAPVSH